MDERVKTKKTGGMWHGYLDGHPEIDERGLTEEVARMKVERVAVRMGVIMPSDVQGVD
jgi:hypothetical protein